MGADTDIRTFAEAKSAADALRGLLDALPERYDTLPQAFETSLARSILETCITAFLLADADRKTDAIILLRSVLEHFSLLKLVIERPDVHRHLQSEYAESHARILKNAATGNPVLEDVASSPRFPLLREAYERLKAESFAAGGRSQTIAARFGRAGHSEEYESIYRLLSLYVHPGYQGQGARFIDRLPEGYRVWQREKRHEHHDDMLSHTLCRLLIETRALMTERGAA